jgi:hypothetical protein
MSGGESSTVTSRVGWTRVEISTDQPADSLVLLLRDDEPHEPRRGRRPLRSPQKAENT